MEVVGEERGVAVRRRTKRVAALIALLLGLVALGGAVILSQPSRAPRAPVSHPGSRSLQGRSEQITFPVDGISDQNLSKWFGGPLWRMLAHPAPPGKPAARIRYARYVVPCEAGETARSRYRTEFDVWRQHAIEAGLKTDVAITAYGPSVPTAARYRAALASLLAGRPVEYLEAWNEPNNFAELNANRSLAPEYMREAAAYCASNGCTPIAGDFLDVAGSANFARQYRATLNSLGVSAHIWGIHPYTDVNGVNDPTAEPEREALKIRAQLVGGDKLWITEAGAYYCFAGRYQWSPRIAEEKQRAAAERLVRTVAPSLGAEHVFYYGLYFGQDTRGLCPREDTELYGESETLRPAGRVILGE